MRTLLLGLSLLFAAAPAVAPAHAESASPSTVYDRVMQTGVLHCGWWNWPPLYTVDANTGVQSGIFFDVMKAFEQATGIKVEWSREIIYSDSITDLQTGKVDAICAGMWPSGLRGKFLLFSNPVFYTPINAYVRAGDARFDALPNAANASDVKAAVMDGEMSSEIRTTDFPASTALALPQLAGSGTELLTNVASGKADITFTDMVTGNGFIKANPNEVKVAGISPVRVMATSIAVNGSELRLKAFIDTALQQLQTSGVIERILRKYDAQNPGALLRVTSPYVPAPAAP